MVDVLTKEQRKFNMSRIRGKDTKPEKLVRSILHSKGYRFRLHVKELPGKPDIVLPKYRKIIEVRGCFWHMHDCEFGRVEPKTNIDFWREKRKSTMIRDAKTLQLLKSQGWQVLIVWECWCKDVSKLEDILSRFMDH